jgi:predicted negative regulator of RcsB-dependent stress response
LARDESTLKESGVETLKHLGAVGVADALMKVIERVPDQIARSGALPGAASLLAGLAGGPLAWGVVLVGGCLLQCRKSRRTAQESAEAFRGLYRKLADIERISRDGANASGLLDELLGQNLELKERLARNETPAQAFSAVASSNAAELGLDTEQFQSDVRVYLSNFADWITEVQKNQATALVEQRDADRKTHQLLNSVLDRLERGSSPAAPTSQEAVLGLLRTSSDFRQTVEAALRRAENLEAEGGADAQAAIANVRNNGDVTKLQELLEQERAHRESRIRQDAAEYVEICRELAAIAIVRGDSAKARRHNAEILRFFPEDYWALITGGRLLLVAGDSVAAKDHFSRAVLLLEAKTRAEPHDTSGLRELSVSYSSIGDVLATQGDGPGALLAYRKDLAIAERLAARDPQNTEWQRDLSVSHDRIGDVLVTQGDGPGALLAYRKGLGIHERLANRDPQNTQWQRDLSVSHNKIGEVLVTQGDGRDALLAYRNGLAIRECLADCDPQNTEWQRDLSVSHERIGDVLVTQGDRPGALLAYRKGLRIHERLANRDPQNTE